MRLVHAEGTEDDLLAACLFEATGVDEEELRTAVARLDTSERAPLIADLAGAAHEPPPQARPRMGGAALPLRDRVRLRRVP